MHEVWYLCIPATLLPDVQRCRGRQLLLLCFIGCINKSKTLVQGLCLYFTLLQCSMHNSSGLVLTEHGRTRRKFMWHQQHMLPLLEQSGWKGLCTPPVLANPTRDETCTSRALKGYAAARDIGSVVVEAQRVFVHLCSTHNRPQHQRSGSAHATDHALGGKLTARQHPPATCLRRSTAASDPSCVLSAGMRQTCCK